MIKCEECDSTRLFYVQMLYSGIRHNLYVIKCPDCWSFASIQLENYGREVEQVEKFEDRWREFNEGIKNDRCADQAKN